MSATVFVCDCEGSCPIDRDTIETALTTRIEPTATSLCGRQFDRFRRRLADGGKVVVACAQQAPRFAEAAELAGFTGDMRFVDVRDRAGWSADGERAGAKMAALIAEAQVPIEPPRAITLASRGNLLVLGRNDIALDAARRLAGRMDVTLVFTQGEGILPPGRTDFPVFRAATLTATGAFGGFEARFSDLAAARPSSRRELRFEATAGAAVLQCDVILDLRGAAPLFPAPQKRDGYFNPDPADPVAIATALFDIADLLGEFEKPRYAEYDAATCAHARSGVVGCTRCMDACPTGAITPADEAIALDAGICAGCGQCGAVCPTGAVTYAVPRPADLLKRLKTLLDTYQRAGGRRPVLLVHDGDHGADMITTLARHTRGLPANLLPLAVNAVTQTGLEILLAARAFGAAQTLLLVAPRQAGETAPLAETIALANHILRALGHGEDINEMLNEPDPDALAALLQDRAANAVTGPRMLPFEPSGDKRSLLTLALSALHAAAPEPVERIELARGAPFGTVEIDVERCTLCLACVGACPVNALRDNPDFPRLSFLERACVQCGLCARTCPEGVIELVPRLDFTGEAQRPRVIKEDSPFECIRCGQPFGSRATIEAVVARMATHAMFRGDAEIARLRMCADCRVIDMAEAGDDPLAGGARPRTRTTDDYLRARNGNGSDAK